MTALAAHDAAATPDVVWSARGRAVSRGRKGRERGAVAEFIGAEDAARAVACVNACAGIADPAALMAAVRAVANAPFDAERNMAAADLRAALGVSP